MKSTSAKREKLILLTQFYDPEPAYKGQLFAEAINYAGNYDVEVVTGFPNFPGGNLYPGYKIKPWQREKINGISITRLALYPSHSSNKFARVANYVSFFLSALIYLCIFGKRARLIYVYHPPLTVGLAAAFSKLIHRKPIVVDVHDLWPDSLPATGMITNRYVIAIIGFLARWLYKKADFIILHTEGFQKKLIDLGVSKSKMKTILGWTNEFNGTELEATHTKDIKKIKNLPGLKLLYAGNIGPAQSLHTILDSLSELKKSSEALEVSFVLIGDGILKSSLKRYSKELKLDNIFFFDRVPQDAIGHFLQAADVLLVHLKKDPLFEITLPSKTQTYLFAGKPILMAVNGEGNKLVEKACAGITVQSENVQEISLALNSFCSMSASDRYKMGVNGKLYYEQELSMQSGIKMFNQIFNKFKIEKD